MKNNLYGEEFLDKLFRDLYTSDVVQHTIEKKDSRYESIKRYMDRLEKIHRNANTYSKKNILEHFYFKKYVVKEENLPDYVDKKMIIMNQKKSLKMWLDYLSSPTSNYPTWAKYWAFQGMLKMGSYDGFSGEYQKRNKKTIAPFIEANPEIIAKCIGTVIKLINGEEVTENVEEKLSKSDSFKKIYQTFEKQFKKNQIIRESNEGIWIKYNQGNKDDAIRLSKSLENKNTGWCTAYEDMAISQVCGEYGDAPEGGDFYVYYTKDQDGKFLIPRIAIRLINHTEIGEIRGVDEEQNLEESMIYILESKLKEMTFLSKEDVKHYLQIIEDLRELNSFIKKTKNNEELTSNEINNLYTKDYGFGYSNDPRVFKLIEKRNFIKDLNIVKNISARQWIIETFVENIEPGTISDKEDIITLIRNIDDIEMALNFGISEFRSDRQVALEAVKKEGWAFECLDPKFKDDVELVLVAIKNNPDIDYTQIFDDLTQYFNCHEIFLTLFKNVINIYTKEQIFIKRKTKAYKLLLESIQNKNYSFKYDEIKLDDKFKYIVELELEIYYSCDMPLYIKMDYDSYQEYMESIDNELDGKIK